MNALLSDIKNKIEEKIFNGIPVIYIYGDEYNRITTTLKDVINKRTGIENSFIWREKTGLFNLEEKNVSSNFKKNKTSEIKSVDEDDLFSIKDLYEQIKITEEKTIFIIEGFAKALEDNTNLMMFSEIVGLIMKQDLPVSLIGISNNILIPPEIEKQTEVINFPLPVREEIEHIINEVCKETGFVFDSVTKNFFIESLNGLSEDEIYFLIISTITKGLNEKRHISRKDIDGILDQKMQIISKSKVIEAEKVSLNMDNVGGLKNLKYWLEKRRMIFFDMKKAKDEFGLETPKGVFLFGAPGVGKSLVAKVISSLYNLPLLKLDMAVIFGSKYPESAAHKALKVADSISPCVLWMDEVEKAFAGAEIDNKGGSETIIRIAGIVLNWMQEKKSPVFVVATANLIDRIRPEFLRRGRFDELFFVGFPKKTSEIQEIIEIHLRNRLGNDFNQKVKPLNYKAIHNKMRQNIAKHRGEEYAGYGGTDLEGLVIDVLNEAFFKRKSSVETKDFIYALNSLKPQRGVNINKLLTKAEEIDALHA